MIGMIVGVTILIFFFATLALWMFYDTHKEIQNLEKQLHEIEKNLKEIEFNLQVLFPKTFLK